MRAQVLLDVEVSEFVGLVKSQKLSELAVGTDDAAVLGVLQVVFADVFVDFLGYISSCDFSALGDTNELSHLVGDLSGLGEATGLSVSVSSLLGGLLGCLDFAFASGPESSDLSA